MLVSRKVFFPNLDGLRFISFLAVFLFHSFATRFDYIEKDKIYHFVKVDMFGNGNLGVNFFFVLSGFLITYLLLKEKEISGGISIKNFYVRRILRIWPLFYFCLLFGFLFFPMLKSFFGEVPNETANPIYYIFFLNNFDFIAKGLPDASILSVLWSIAVEEQFYFIWHLLFYFLSSRYYSWIFLFFIITPLIFRAFYVHDEFVLEYHSISVISDMAIGGLAAYLTIYNTAFLNSIKNLNPSLIVLIYSMAGIVFFFKRGIFSNPITWVFEREIIALLFAFIILEQNFSERSYFKFSSFKIISRLGKYTYGMYCLQFLGILIAAVLLRVLGWNTQLWQVLLLEFFISLALTILFAYLSYQFFESKFLNLKSRFAFINQG
jgi:peptidoglycan/LPS O-acetylase OafA/YrhL